MEVIPTVCLTDQSHSRMQATWTALKKCRPRLSYRVAIARKSFSRLIQRSTTCRPSYATASNAGGRPPRDPRFSRASRASARSGHTHRMPRRRSSRRNFLAPYARSRRNVVGRLRGRPLPARGTRTVSSSGSRKVGSLACPSETSTANGRAFPSVSTWILLVRPPRLAPSHSPGIKPFFEPGRRLACTGSTAVRFDVGAVGGRAVPVDVALRVVLDLQGGEDALPRAVARPADEAIKAGLPRAVTLGNVTPGGAGLEAPEDAVDDAAVVGVGVPTWWVAGQVGVQVSPLCLGEVRSAHAARLRPPHELQSDRP